MAEIPPPPVPTQLIVFADDWGRHPSSSQHLIRELLPHYPTLWVNTVGTRRPRLSLFDLSRGLSVITSWFRTTTSESHEALNGLQIVAPPMYPGYRSPWQRQINDRSITHAVKKALLPHHRHVAITTLPTTAMLPALLNAQRWIYYCVDDYSQWPGTDHAVMDAMERQLLQRVAAVACVSKTLQERVESIGQRDSTLLTHGVDVNFWQRAQPPTVDEFGDQADGYMDLNGSPITFWGLIDERIEKDWISKLSKAISNQPLKICLVGPSAENKQAWTSLTYDRTKYGEVIYCGSVDHDKLPAIAYFAAVLIMPYIDATVTRAMQPLKFKEYLATMKPVVVRDLPSTREWADCCDLASDANSFVRLVQERIKTGTPPEQIEARKRRLAGESWAAKAKQLADMINAS